MITSQQRPARAELQLQKVMDRILITDLINRQGLWLDEKWSDKARSIFPEGATDQTPGGSARSITKL